MFIYNTVFYFLSEIFLMKVYLIRKFSFVKRYKILLESVRRVSEDFSWKTLDTVKCGLEVGTQI